MGIFSSLSKLFQSTGDSSEANQAETVEYNGYQITPTPQADQGQYRVCAVITKGSAEEVRSHTFIRSDLLPSYDQCVELTVRKAKLTIDQLGEQIF
ncbi:HlyU family transcriptional regulator [Marinomonas ostreistagni]|uniref:HlyU family transcriptional regulator n=1 Tax=Marinomonas ostreistagni TaxID=359209 RepID=UPI00194DD9C2|nr:HlyU family transcriptional regulator [Marinomonas ostreistagni]MBM6551360.1 transcriptional regulator [Marinomonas ostreistagni]